MTPEQEQDAAVMERRGLATRLIQKTADAFALERHERKALRAKLEICDGARIAAEDELVELRERLHIIESMAGRIPVDRDSGERTQLAAELLRILEHSTNMDRWCEQCEEFPLFDTQWDRPTVCRFCEAGEK